MVLLYLHRRFPHSHCLTNPLKAPLLESCDACTLLVLSKDASNRGYAAHIQNPSHRVPPSAIPEAFDASFDSVQIVVDQTCPIRGSPGEQQRHTQLF